MNDQTSTIEVQIDGSVSGDVEITGQYVIIRIGGDVEGSVTVKQEAMANPHDVLVEVGGERIHPEDQG